MGIGDAGGAPVRANDDDDDDRRNRLDGVGPVSMAAIPPHAAQGMIVTGISVDLTTVVAALPNSADSTMPIP